MASLPQENPTDVTLASEESDGPRELNRLEILRGLRISNWEAASSTLWAALTTGAFLTGFALWLGANDAAIGVLTAIPIFAGLIQIVASYFAERRSERKRFTAWFATAGRMLWLPILLLPFLLPRALTLFPFLLLFTLSYVLLNIPVPAWMSWMSDLVPPDHRGRYFGQRNMIAGIVGMVIALPAAWFLDAAKAQHRQGVGFATLFGIGVLGGLFSFFCLLRQPEPPKRPSSLSETTGGPAGVLAFYRAPFADRNFRRLMLFNTVFGIGQNFAAPFFLVYAIKNLHLDYVWLQVFAVMTGLTNLAFLPLWGYLTDKFGNKPLLAIGVVGVFTLPIGWMLTSPQTPLLTLAVLSAVNLGGGMFWALVTLSQFNLLISLSPPEKTPVYVAAMAAVTGLAGGLAPLVGSATMGALEGWKGHLFGHTLLNYHITFLLSALLRIVALIFLGSVEDRHATPARDVLQQIGKAGPRTWFYIHRLQRGSDPQARLRATEALAAARSQLAVGELVAALTDPNRDVRVRAARALGEIGDPASVKALLASLHDPAAGLVEEAARALGRIGDRRANAALIALLLGDPAAVPRADRLAAARALGESGGSDAVEALLTALDRLCAQHSGDEEMAGVVVAALGRIGAKRAAPAMAAYLERTDTSRPLRLSLIRALGELGDPDTLPALRATLTQSGADSILLPSLADALARLEDRDSALPLLATLAHLASPVARKQVANAVGTLLGQSERIYNLLSKEDFARDNAVSRHLKEMQRALRSQPEAAERLRAALDAYISAGYADFARALDSTAQALSSSTSSTPYAALCRRVLKQVASQTDENLPVETVLVALCALQTLVASTD